MINKQELLKILLYILSLYINIEIIHAKKFCDIHKDFMTEKCYEKEVLATISHSPNQIVVDRNTNVLYFSFDNGLGEYIPAKLVIGNNTLFVLKGIKDAFAMASDFANGDIYFGGSHGIYKYNPAFRTLKRLAVQNLDIWWLVIRKRIYFIKFPSLTAFKYENRSIKVVPQLREHTVHQFVFDIEDNIFFINNTGLYGIRWGRYDAILLRDYPKFLGMATDNFGYIYLCSDDGIFIISKEIQRIKRIFSIKGVLGMTFDKDNNLIYSDSREIVRLVVRDKPKMSYKNPNTFFSYDD